MAPEAFFNIFTRETPTLAPGLTHDFHVGVVAHGFHGRLENYLWSTRVVGGVRRHRHQSCYNRQRQGARPRHCDLLAICLPGSERIRSLEEVRSEAAPVRASAVRKSVNYS